MRYIIGIIVTLGLIVLLFVLLLNIGGRNNNGTPPPEQTPLVGYANTSKTVRFTQDGTIGAEDTHRSIEIEVGQNQTTLTVYKGYDSAVERTRSYSHSQETYQVFLHALQRAGFEKGNTDPKLGDERGACPTGYRYLMQVWDGETRLQHLWATSCNGVSTFKGNFNQVNTLFQRQVPDYGQLTSDVRLQ